MATPASGNDFRAYPFDFRSHAAPAPDAPFDGSAEPIVIVGGGIAGLTLALGLAAQGVRSVVLEADDTVCYGSRAICFSRRSLEIFERIGVLAPVLDKGLAWTGGRSFYRNTEVLHFQMPHDRRQKLPPMVNLQQYHVEEYLVQALERHAGLVDLRWQSRVTAVDARPDHVELQVAQPGRRYSMRAQWVVACDGGRSALREARGLRLEGTAYEGRYVVADIALKCDLPTERLAWFDPPSNPGSTILMHRQPDDIWRIDYQLRDDENGDDAVKPENVLPRVDAHLRMIGLGSAWSPIWITLYRANALTLPRYRDGRVLFAGDAAHLVPIFGVRGANSTIDDVDNLAWKLALVVAGKADARLLDSYSDERVHAAHENLAYGRKSTQFMAPPDFAFRTLREAVLALALDTPAVRPLINPRQSSPVRYDASPLNATADGGDGFAAGPSAGSVLPEGRVTWFDRDGRERAGHLTDALRPGVFTAIHFGAEGPVPPALTFAREALRSDGIALRIVAVRRRPAQAGIRAPADIGGVDEAGVDEADIGPSLDGASVGEAHIDEAGVDEDGELTALYGASDGSARPPRIRAEPRANTTSDALYAVRPDGHVLGRWRPAAAAALEAAVRAALGGGHRSIERKPDDRP